MLAVVAGSRKSNLVLLLEPRRRLRHAASTTCRRRPATATRCRSCSSSTTASGWSARSRSTRGCRGPEKLVAVDASSGYGLRFALAPHTRARRTRAGPPLRARSARATRSSASSPAGETRPASRCVDRADGRALGVQGRTRSPSSPAPARASTVIKVADDDARGRRSCSRARERRRRSRSRPRRARRSTLAPGTYEVDRARRQGPRDVAQATIASQASCRRAVAAPTARGR